MRRAPCEQGETAETVPYRYKALLVKDIIGIGPRSLLLLLLSSLL